MKRLLTIIKMEARMVLSNRRALFLGLVLPVVLYLFWSSGASDKMIQATFHSDAKVAFPAFYLLGMMAFAAIANAIFGYAPATAALSEQGILRRVRSTPLPTWQFLGSRLFVQLLVILANSAVLTVIAIAGFGVQLTWRTVPLGIVFLILTAAMFLAIGQLIASLAPKQSTAMGASRLVGFVLVFAGNIAFPVTRLPHILQQLLPWTPGSVAMGLLRPAFLLGEVGPRAALNVAVLVGYIVVASVLAIRAFRWDVAA